MNTSNPLLGVLLHAIGGFAAGSFYAPLKKVTPWAWESLWLVMGLAAWLIAPWAVGFATTSDLIGVLAASPLSAWLGCLLFGLLWGIGNLGFGLSVRYLGMALGYSIALGSCMIFGTLMPPIANGQLSQIVSTHSGMMILAGVMMCLAGIALCGWAGARKEKELQFEAPLPKARTSGSPAAGDQGDMSSPSDATTQAAGEFSIGRGFLVATMAGILSACFAFGLAAGKPIANNFDGWQSRIAAEAGVGLILDPKDAAAAARQLVHALNDAQWLAEVPARARRLAEGEFSRDRLAAQLGAILEAAAKRQC